MATAVIVGLSTTLATIALVPPVSRWVTATAAMLGLVAAALAVARRAGFRVWLIAAVGVIDFVAYLTSPESSIWAAAGAAVSGALAAFLLMMAPDDRRRNRIQAYSLGGFIVLLLAAVGVVVLAN